MSPTDTPEGGGGGAWAEASLTTDNRELAEQLRLLVARVADLERAARQRRGRIREFDGAVFDAMAQLVADLGGGDQVAELVEAYTVRILARVTNVEPKSVRDRLRGWRRAAEAGEI